jgi:large subunit ribosomal protein L31e
MADLERTYTIPLRKGWLSAPLYRRAKRAVHEVQNFVKKHMKTDNVLVGPQLNMKIWERGMRNPPHKVKVTAIKNDKGECRVELFGHKFESTKKDKSDKKMAKGAEELAEKIKSTLKEKDTKKEDTEKKTEAPKKTETSEKKDTKPNKH